MKHNTRILLGTLVFSVVSLCSTGQEQKTDFSFNDKFNDANLLIDEKLWESALTVWLDIWQSDTANPNWNYKAGICYLNSNTMRKNALPFLQKAAAKTGKNYNPFSPTEKNTPHDAVFYLAKAYQLNDQFDSAIVYYNNFKTMVGKKHFLVPEVDLGLSMCANAKEIMAKPVTVNITNLGNAINTSDPEYGPLISLDERALYFTSRRLWLDSSNLDIKERSDGKFFEDIYVSYKGMDGKWGNPEMLNFNRRDDHEATVSLSPDGQTIYLYIDDGGDGNIYQSFLFGETWTSPVPLGAEINSKSQESHVTIALDNKTLYFSSDRKGGVGGKDIYFCTKLPNGKWSQAQNIGLSINTPYDEDAPFIHPDGKTLYFSSKGHKSMGGFDIFMTTKKEDGTWNTPENIGYPINTTDDDIFFILSPDGKRAYYSSFRSDGLGDKDIYLVEQPTAIEKQLTLIKGYITVPEGMELPEDVTIIVTDNETGNFITEIKPLKRNGSFVFVIPPGKNYNISYVANEKEFYNENVYVPVQSEYKEVDKVIEVNPSLLGTTDATKINIVSSTDKPKPQFQIRSREPGFMIPDSSYIQYLNADGAVIYEELLSKSGFFNYYELDKSQPYIFTLKSKDTQFCKNAEIAMIGNADSSLNLKFIPDENCVFKEVKPAPKPQFQYAELEKQLSDDIIVVYMDDSGKILFEEKMDTKGYFSFRKLPAEVNYIIQLKSNDGPICDKGEIVVPGPGGNFYLAPDAKCVYRVIEKKSTFVYDALGKATPAGIAIQYIGDDGQLIEEANMDRKGEFKYKELSADKPYSIKLKSNDKTLCDKGEITVPGPGGISYTMVADENCVFRMKGKQSQFTYDALGKTMPAGIAIQYIADDGKLIEETKIDRKGQFNYKELSSDKPYSIKLKSNDKTLCDKGEITVPGPGGISYTMVADENCVFRLVEKKSKIVFTELQTEKVKGITIQAIDDNGKIVFEDKMNEKGEFAYHKLPADKKYSLKILDEQGAFKDAQIIVPTIGKSYQTFVPDEAGIFRLKGAKDASAVAAKEKAKEKTPPSDSELKKAAYCEYNQANINTQHQDELNATVKILKDFPAYTVEISGHTDANGTDEYNIALSNRRAENASRFLIAKGISKSRISVKGFGESQPIAPNINPDGSDNPEGRQSNRRIDLKINR